MREKTCCFTGHREITGDISKLKTKLKLELTKLINNGIIYFGVGGARGFDLLASETVIELKAKYSQIKLILILPCATQTKNWNYKDIEKYEYIKSRSDKIKILSKDYYNGCMHARNRHMVNCASVCVCYKRKKHRRNSIYSKLRKAKGLANN